MLATPRPFIAFIRREARADFRVSFPDFPDCVSSGKTIVEARRNAERALAVHCWRLRYAGAPLPPPSFMHDIAAAGRLGDLVMLVPPPDLSP
jgi:predicted RNase H-like HicB family nuclease